MTLPYENATSGKSAIDEMRRLVRAFGASSFGCMEDFAAKEVIVQFVIGRVFRHKRQYEPCESKGSASSETNHTHIGRLIRNKRSLNGL